MPCTDVHVGINGVCMQEITCRALDLSTCNGHKEELKQGVKRVCSLGCQHRRADIEVVR